MKRVFALSLCFLFVATFLTPVVAAAESHRFELLKEGTINGVKLKPGQYTLELEGESLGKIHKRKEVLVEAVVEVLPIAGAMPQSVSQSRDGQVKEIRFKTKRVVFVNTDASAETAR